MSISEIEVLALDIQRRHGSAARLAALVCLTSAGLRRLTRGTDIDLSWLRALGRMCVIAYAEKHDIRMEDVNAALRSFEQAGQTVRYLSSLPD